MIGDIQPKEGANTSKMGGSMPYVVFATGGSFPSIQPGEPVQKLAGTNGVTALLTNSPTTTNKIVGVAASASSETATVDGLVQVIPASNGQTWVIAPKVPATFATQADYNALVGSAVLLDLTSGVYTILAADGAGNGCIIEYLDIATFPGQVHFSWNPTCDYRAV